MCTELYPPSSRPAAMGTTLNSWLALSSSTCFSADECLSLFSAFKLRQFLYQSIWPPPSPPQSGLSLKLNQHDVFSSSLPSFVCFSFMFFFFFLSPLMPLCPGAAVPSSVLRRSQAGTRKKTERKHKQRENACE